MEVKDVANMKLGKTIRSFRTDRKMSIAELGRKILMDSSSIANIEGGRRNITFTIFVRVLNGLEISLSEFSEKYDQIE